MTSKPNLAFSILNSKTESYKLFTARKKKPHLANAKQGFIKLIERQLQPFFYSKKTT